MLDNFYHSPLNTNYTLVNADEKVYIYNSYGHISIRGKTSYALCQWILQEIDHKTSISNLVAKTPSHLQPAVEQLLKQFIENNFIYSTANIRPTPSFFFEQLLKNYCCYKPDVEEPYHKLSQIDVTYVVNGNAFCMIAEELALWPLKNCIATLNERHIALCHFLMSISENYCLIIVNSQSLYITIEYNHCLVSIHNLRHMDSNLLIQYLEQSLQKIKMDSTIQVPQTNVFQILAYDLLANLFNHMLEPPTQENKNIKILNKQTLEFKLHRDFLLMDSTLQKISSTPAFLNKNVIRWDIPIVENNLALIAELEEINQQILELIDSFTGPITWLDEGSHQQLPLSISECQIFHTIKPIRCVGISARECRNQVVLYALETLVQPSGNYGIGWCSYEAMFRAVRHMVHHGLTSVAHCKFKKYQLFNTQIAVNASIGYLKHRLQKEINPHELSVSFTKLDTCIYICRIKYQGSIILEPGLSVKQALITALCHVMIVLQHPLNNEAIHAALSWETITPQHIEKFVQYGLRHYQVFYSNRLFFTERINKPILIQLINKNDSHEH